MLKKLIKKHNNKEYKLVIAFSPKEKKKEFESLFGKLNYLAQKGESLGDKMLNSISSLLKTNKKVIVIGSDTPNISKDEINLAFKKLNNSDIVLGPAYDGGYYLIGMKKENDIFQNITWSTNTVFKETIKLIKKQNLSYSKLKDKHDLDTINELELLKEFINP